MLTLGATNGLPDSCRVTPAEVNSASTQPMKAPSADQVPVVHTQFATYHEHTSVQNAHPFTSSHEGSDIYNDAFKKNISGAEYYPVQFRYKHARFDTHSRHGEYIVQTPNARFNNETIVHKCAIYHKRQGRRIIDVHHTSAHCRMRVPFLPS